MLSSASTSQDSAVLATYSSLSRLVPISPRQREIMRREVPTVFIHGLEGELGVEVALSMSIEYKYPRCDSSLAALQTHQSSISLRRLNPHPDHLSTHDVTSTYPKMSSTPMKVYKVRYSLAKPDDDLPNARYYTVIFVETDPSTEAGIVHHVTGNLVKGMSYTYKFVSKPERSLSFHSKDFIGVTAHPSDPLAFNRICEAVPPPPKQIAFNSSTGMMEQIKPNGRFYAPGEPVAPLSKWTEWVEERAIPALRRAGVLRDVYPNLPHSSSSSSSSQQAQRQVYAQTPGGMRSQPAQQIRQPQQVQNAQAAGGASSQTQQPTTQAASTSTPVYYDHKERRYTRLPNGALSWL